MKAGLWLCSFDLRPAHHRLSARACQRHKRVVVAEGIRLSRQVPDEFVGRPRDVHTGYALGPTCHNAGHVERYAQVRRLRLEVPPGEFLQAGCLGLGRVQDGLDVYAGTVTSGADILTG